MHSWGLPVEDAVPPDAPIYLPVLVPSIDAAGEGVLLLHLVGRSAAQL